MWILNWRLAADAARNMGMIDLVSPVPGGESAYQRMKKEARENGSWRGLHDNAMYAVMTARQLNDSANRLRVSYGEGTGGKEVSLEAAILAELEPLLDRQRIKNEPIGDRLRILFENRIDTEDERRQLELGGKRGIAIRTDAAGTLTGEADRLLADALDSLKLAEDYWEGTSGEEKASLLYLEALILSELGYNEESKAKAAAAIEADPQHSRARELLPMETNPS